MSTRLRDLLSSLAAAALGLAAFFLFVGWTTLLPTNIAWLDFADRAMHTLGWMFFRETSWHLPPGLSPDLGIELSSSIALVDGLPLFALPLKLVAPLLPQPFQYWGYWLALSFVLQSLFAYAVARELGAGRILALVAAGFALITPAFMFRVPMHLALSGHWTVLAALYLYVRRDPPKLWMWPLLVGLTAAIHAYLLAMVGALWFAALIERLWTGRISKGGALAEAAIVMIATAIVLWAAGFLLSGSLGSYGYGDYKLNLLWPLIRYNWSQIFPDLPHTKFDYEGMGFLGIGILALLLVAFFSGAFVRLKSALARRWLPLAVMLVLLMLFGFSDALAFGSIELGKIPLPGWAINAASTFRSTGRFVWPLLYFITIGAVALVGRHLRPAAAIPLVIVAFAAQAADSGPRLMSFASRVPPPAASWKSPLVSPFWERAVAAGYNRIRVIPIQNPGKDWDVFGYFAVTHHMDVDSAYLGRTNEAAMVALKAHERQVFATGAVEPHTLYVLDVESALEISRHLAPDDCLAVIDQHIVFARGGAALLQGLGIAPMPILSSGTGPSPGWAPTGG